MSANLGTFRGRTAMFYAGKETPWHGTGVKLEKRATAAEALEAAGLDWEVHRRPIYNAEGQQIPNYQALVRSDTSDVLSVLGDRYVPLQNREGFNFFDEVVGEGQAIYDTAGCIGNGYRVWILAKLPGEIILDDKDKIDKYLLLANGHDGTLAFRMFFTPVRVVCQNTLNASLSKAASGLYLKHTKNILTKVTQAKKLLGIVNEQYAKFEVNARILLATKVANKEILADYVDSVFPVNRALKPEQVISRRMGVIGLMEGSETNNIGKMSGTWWSAYNAVTEYIDHGRLDRLSTEYTDTRLNNIWMGQGATVKQKAINNALEICGVKN
jgi:phage/plasmid-like protein (TIGR03299 family)